MDDFRKFESMHAGGADARAIYLAGKADGLDEITLIRLVRKVCGLSLAQAKEVSGAAAALDAGQEVTVGGTVHWEGWSSVEGFYLVQARVSRIENGLVYLDSHRKFLVTGEGLEEVHANGAAQSPIRRNYFDKPLSQRLAESLEFVDGLGRG